MTRYADPASITPSQPHLAAQYLKACGVEWDVLGVEAHQLAPGDVVIVGPWDTWDWLPAHVAIEIIPDGGDVKRIDPLVYALRRVGLTPSTTPKTPRAASWQAYQGALAWLAALPNTTSRPNPGTSTARAEVVTTVPRGREVLRLLDAAPAYAFDFETDSLDPYAVTRHGAAFATATNAYWFIDTVTEALRDEVIQLLRTRPFRGSNLKYDLAVASTWARLVPEDFAAVWDTQLLHWLGRPDDFQHGLKYITKQQLKRDVLALDDVGGPELFWSQPHETQALYAAAGDARNSFDLVDHLWDALSPSLRDLYTRVEQPVVPILAAMELQGLTLDRAKLKELHDAAARRLQEIKVSLSGLGFEGNPDADTDLADYLYSYLQLPVLSRTPKLQRGRVDVDTLLRLQLLLQNAAGADLAAVQLIREWSTVSKQLSSFYSGPYDSHIDTFYFSLLQTGTKTGRLATRPNSQNWPDDVRSMVIAPHDGELTDADLGQIEPRLSAHFSQDPEMLRDFNERALAGIDVYQSLGLTMGHELAALGKHTALRKNIKTVFLADQYGTGVFKIQAIALKQGDFIPIDDCRKLQQGIHSARPHYYRSYQPALIKEARRTGRARDPLFGRERSLARGLYAIDPGTRDAAEREALNYPNQAGAGSILKLAKPDVQRLYRAAGGSLINSIHDELLGWTPALNPHERAEFNHEKQRIMESVVDLSVPIVAEVGHGRTWKEAKDDG